MGDYLHSRVERSCGKLGWSLFRWVNPSNPLPKVLAACSAQVERAGHQAGFCPLLRRSPQGRTKDVETGLIPEWDGEWIYHFRSGGYERIEWVEIRVTSPEQKEAVLNALKSIHVPGERAEHGYRVFGYAEPGKATDYIN